MILRLVTRFLAWLRAPVVRRWRDAERTAEVELRARLPALLLAAALAWNAAAPSAAAVMTAAALAAMLGLGLAWTWALARGLRAARQLRYAALQVGDELEEQLTVENHGAWPALWLEVVDRSDLPDYPLAGVRALSGNSTLRWRARTQCRRRGAFHLGPWELLAGDPFGFFRARVEMTRRQELIVLPPLAALPQRLLPHASASGDWQRLRQPRAAESISASGVRQHQPGDPLRRIHWPTTARYDQVYTRVFEPEAAASIWIVLDLDPRAQWGQAPDSTEEMLVLLAASLAAHLAQRHIRFGLLAAGEAAPVRIHPEAGQAQAWRMLAALAPLHAGPGLPPLAVFAGHFRRLVTPRSLLLVLTASLDADWPAALARGLPAEARAQVTLVDPQGYGGPPGADAFAAGPASHGLSARVTRRGEVRPLKGAYGQLRRWQFQSLGTGRVVVRQTPRDAALLEVLGPESIP